MAYGLKASSCDPLNGLLFQISNSDIRGVHYVNCLQIKKNALSIF